MSLDDVKLRLIESTDDATGFISWARQRRNAPLAVDTETTGFNWWGSDHVRLVQVGDADTGWAMRWDRWSGLFAAAMREHTGGIDMMNAPFDWSFINREGINLPRRLIGDVGVMSHILEPHMRRGLKEQARRHVDPRAASGRDDLDGIFESSGWTWATVPHDLPEYWFYGALDTVLTSRLRAHHWPLVEAQAPYAYEVESAVQWVTRDMTAYGTCVDVGYAAKMHDEFVTYCDAVETWCQKEYNVKPGSNAKIVEILAGEGYEFTKATKSGAVALDREVLGDIDHPLARAVLRRRELQKIASTYLRFYVNHADVNSLLHPSINSLGARTSRMSMDHPNFQNLPRGANEAARVVRNCVVARPGHVLLMCDFDQVEMRILAHLCRDPQLIAAFHSGEDFFVNLARTVFQDNTILKPDPRRQITKNVGYAKIYGAGVAKLAQTAGVPVDQASAANRAFDQAYPGVRAYVQDVWDVAMRRGADEGSAYATCPITQRRHYADRGKEYALVNYQIQGAAAAILKIKILELAAAGLDRWMVLPVHDEIILDVPQEDAPDAVRVLRSVMNDRDMLRVPLSASVSYGARWGEKKPWESEK